MLSLLAAGCGLQAPEKLDAPTLDWPEFPATGTDRALLRVDRNASGAWFEVDPAGPLARLGHSHVIGGAIVDGRVLLGGSAADSAVELRLDLAAVEVDRPDWRAAAGLDPELEPEAVAGTRRNLLGPAVLDVERHPRIELRSAALERDEEGWRIAARLRFQQRIVALTAPLALAFDGQQLTATGAFTIDHAALGLAPFSAARGALRVAETIRVRFRIVAVGDPADVAIIRRLDHWLTGSP